MHSAITGPNNSTVQDLWKLLSGVHDGANSAGGLLVLTVAQIGDSGGKERDGNHDRGNSQVLGGGVHTAQGRVSGAHLLLQNGRARKKSDGQGQK